MLRPLPGRAISIAVCLASVLSPSFFTPLAFADNAPATGPAASPSGGGIAFNDPAHGTFFKYQMYLADSKPYRGRMFPYFRVFLGSDGGWADDDRIYPQEHWYTPNNPDEWKALTADQQIAKVDWTENALAHLLNHFVEDPSILADSQPNAPQFIELIRAVWGRDTLKKFKDLEAANEDKDDPQNQPKFDRALADVKAELKGIAKTLPALVEAPKQAEATVIEPTSQPPSTSTAPASSPTITISSASNTTSAEAASSAPIASTATLPASSTAGPAVAKPTAPPVPPSNPSPSSAPSPSTPKK